MAKNKETENPTDDKIMLDGIPGADKKTAEDAEGFKVDLNFEDNDEVEFPKEDEIEEVEEEQEPTPDTEEEEGETEEGETEEGETEEPETPDEVEESEGEEGVLESDETDPSESETATPEEPKEPMIPKSRFDEVLAKQKALAKKLEEATTPKIEDVKEAPDFNFEEKEIEYQNALLDGEADQATKIRNEIRTAEKQQMMFEMQTKMGQTAKQTSEQQALEAKAIEIQNKHDILNENHPNYNVEKTDEVLELRDAYILQGYTGADALEKAVSLLVPEPTDSNVSTQKKVTEKKQVANTKKKLEAAESQPPSLKGKNKVEKKIDLDVLSTEEFDALPEETLKRMRGDFG